ncbi:MAG: FAD-dependent oxidoreductase [Pontixanthobacter sp.]
MTTADYAIIGAGMAGASIAAELARHASIVVLEAEDQPGYHATGRSAAFWEETYGGPHITPLTIASGPFLRKNGFLKPRGALYIARHQERGALDAHFARFAGKGVAMERLDTASLHTKLPGLREDWNQAVWQPECADIDVGGLHAHYMGVAKSAGAQLLSSARIISIARERTQWRLTTQDGREIYAKRIVNAAGAWADEVATMAGIAPVGITPFRRTVVQLRTDPAPNIDMPLVLDISGQFYFKPENGRLWLSPHDEVPSMPCDTAPEELDVAQAVARFEQVMDWRALQVERKWAGLRSFAPDRLPVYGPDPADRDFIWFAGQGGFGIQTAPAAAAVLAGQLIADAGSVNVSAIVARQFSPHRFG